MNGYVCFYNQKRIEVKAETTLQAHESAKAAFKPPKSKAHMITCVLAERYDADDKPAPVTHTPDF